MLSDYCNGFYVFNILFYTIDTNHIQDANSCIQQQEKLAFQKSAGDFFPCIKYTTQILLCVSVFAAAFRRVFRPLIASDAF